MSLRTLLAATALAVLAASVPTATAATSATISGRVLDSAGRPVKGAWVQVRRDPDLSFFSGLFCFFSRDPDCWWHYAYGVTDATGTYRIKVRSDEPIGESGIRTVTATQPGKAPVRARTELVLDFQEVSVRLPDLRFWAGDVSVDPDLVAARAVRVPPLPPEYGRPLLGSTPTAWLYQGSGVAWDYGFVPYARQADARTVEAGTTAIAGRQRATLDGYQVTYYSVSRPVTGGVRPLSRGRACYTYDARGRAVRLSRCGLTDGRLDRAVKLPSGVRLVGGVLVDLGSVRSVGAVAGRGCEVEKVEVSADNKTFTVVEPLPAAFDSDLRVSRPADARYVRVTPEWSCSGLREVSVFGPLP